MNQSVFDRKPILSVVMVVYNMAREAPRTLYSLSAAYQKDIAAEDYEVIVVDNGSSPAFDTSIFDELEGNFRAIRLDPAPRSPAHALNVGIAAARGDIIGVMIDGARIVTPGLLHFARMGVGLYPRAVVATLGWYLGMDQQRWSAEGGYNQDREDAMLESINWREDGYRLFEISAPDETTTDGWFGAICESNALFLSRKCWMELGGVEEMFDVPGGGFVNLDLVIRAYELPESRLVVMLGEGTFHQVHGGIATNAKHDQIDHSVSQWRAQYKAIRGRDWAPPTKGDRVYLGALPQPALKHFARSIVEPANAPPLGPDFNRDHWTLSWPPQAKDPVVDALVELAREQIVSRTFPAAVVVARMARQLAPDEPAVLIVLQMASAWVRGPADPNDLGPIWRVRYYIALGRAHAIMGHTNEAIAAFEAALAVDCPPTPALRVKDDLRRAILAIVKLRMPGPDFQTWLTWLHANIRPRLYLEIGVAAGESFQYARAPTIAVGVDPEPNLQVQLRAESHVFPETSDDFFSQQRLEIKWPSQPVNLAFIDGAHAFAQVLRDFVNVEARCHPNALIAINDTMPFSELSQSPAGQSNLHHGDVWKLVLCLKHYRPDLDIITLPASPSGLTLVGNLNPRSPTLRDNLDEAIARFEQYDFNAFQENQSGVLNIVPNEWESFERHFGLRLPGPADIPDDTSGRPMVSGSSRALYVDLLSRALTNTIYKDVSTRPDDGPEHDPESREIGSDWPANAHSMVGTLRMKNLAELTQRVLDENIPGDLIEAGVWRGGCCILMRGILAANGVMDRKIYAADSFEGLPPPNVEAYPADTGYDLSHFDQLAVSVETVKDNFDRYGLLDDSVTFVKGFFSDTLPTLDAGPFALIRLDGDLYESTYVSLETLYPKLSPGGFVVIDDMNFIPPCKQAVLDYRAKMGITAPMHRVDWSASWWRKE